MKLRKGRKIPRNLYIQIGDEPSDLDVDIGRVESEALAEFLIECANSELARSRNNDDGVFQLIFDRAIAGPIIERGHL